MQALGRGDPDTLFASLPAIVVELGIPMARAVAFDLVRIHGDYSKVPLLFEIAAIEGLGPWSKSAGADAFESALGEHLARDERAFDRLPLQWYRLDDHVLSSMLRAIGHSERPRGIDLLIRELSSESRATGVFIAQLARLAPFASPAQDESLREALREALEHEHEGVRKAAAVALGRLEDRAAVPRLIDLLDTRSGGLRRTAHWSLRQITDLTLPPDVQRWSTWYREEMDWLENRAPLLVKHLYSEDDAEVANAAREIALHPFQGSQFATEITVLFEYDSPGIRAFACDCLAQLGSDAVLEELLDALTYDVETVHLRAWNALKTITGLDLPPEADTWAQALGEREGAKR